VAKSLIKMDIQNENNRDFKIGDHIRILKNKKLFSKGNE